MLRHSYLNVGILAIALSAAVAIVKSRALGASSSPAATQVEALGFHDWMNIPHADHQGRIMTVMERGPVTTMACADRDLRVIIAIEQRGSLGDMRGTD
jgi:hypothetical protein